MLILLLLLSMFFGCDAGDGQEQPRDLYEGPQDAVLMDQAEEERIAIDQVRQSLDRMLIRRDNYYDNISLDVIPSDDLYDQRTNLILDEYDEARNEGGADDFARIVLQFYLKDRPKFAKRGVQFPELDAFDNPVTINVPLFQSVGMANDQPLTDLDKAIKDIFIDAILKYKDSKRAASVPPIKNIISSPLVRPGYYSRAVTSSPFAAPSALQQLSSAVEPVHVLNRVQSLSQSPRDQFNRSDISDILNLARRSLENHGVAREMSVEPLALPSAADTPEVLPKTGVKKQREETPEEESQQQGRRVRPRFNEDPGNQLKYHRPDDRNDPDGGGIPVIN